MVEDRVPHVANVACRNGLFRPHGPDWHTAVTDRDGVVTYAATSASNWWCDDLWRKPNPNTRSRDAQPLRVGHKIIIPGSRLQELPARLDGAGWDMVELDVLSHGDRLVVAHDPSDLEQEVLIDFADALAALAELLPEHVGLDVDIKTTGYETRVRGRDHRRRSRATAP